MELRNEPKIGLELKLRKIAIVASVFAVLITVSVFIYTNLSSSSDTFAGVQSTSNTITGSVFCDIDQDQTQDEFESDLDNVKIWLINDADGDGTIDAGESIIDSTVTNSSGDYSFTSDYSAGSGTITVAVATNNDDADEKSNGDIDRDKEYLRINDRTIGLRFQDVSIPQGATVTSATITLNSWDDKDKEGSVKIYGHDIDNSGSISSNDDDITDRTKTSSKVTWTFTEWDEDVDYNTPSIATVVQEIVNRNGWSSGNDMMFIIEKNSGKKRKVTARDYSSSYAPELTITYSSDVEEGGSSSFIVLADTSCHSGSNVSGNISRSVTFNSGGNTSNNNDFGFINSCGSSAKNRICGKVFNDANQNGNMESGESGCQNVKLRLHRDKDGSGTLNEGDECFDSTTTDVGGAFDFVVDFESSGGSSTTFSKKISHKDRDAEENSDGDVYTEDNDLDLNEHMVSLLFDGVTVPQGATITSAYVKFKSEDDEDGSAYVKIYAEDTDDASAFSESRRNLTNRTKTSNYVTWSLTEWEEDEYYNSADIKTVIQEVVDRSGWTSGNNLNVMFFRYSGDDRDAIPRDESSSSAPEIFITYTTGSSNANKFIVEIDDESGNLDEVISEPTTPVAFSSSGNQSEEFEVAAYDASALPVDLMYISAKNTGTGAEILWATAMEENNSHFDIERSIDGSSFNKIDEVSGNGNSMNIIEYQYLDYLTPTQDDPVYYRLKQVDFDGQFEYSPVVYVISGIEDEANIYPNPAVSFINISKQGYRFSVQLISQSGLVVASRQNVLDKTQIPVGQIPTGLYVAQIKSRNGEESHKLLVKH